MKKNKYWTEDFVITDVVTYEDDYGYHYDITFLAKNEDIIINLFDDDSEKLDSLIHGAIGYSVEGIKIHDEKFPGLIGRLVKGTLFQNENRLGEISYNIDYFKVADNYYQADLFFQKFNKNWTEERKTEYSKRLDYVDYLKNEYDYDIHQSLIDAAISNGDDIIEE